MDLFAVFPEFLALCEKYPQELPEEYKKDFRDNIDLALWAYKWILSNCEQFYQIPMKDCLAYFEDYKKRSLAYGYNLRPYYYKLYQFYKDINQEKAQEYYEEYQKIPWDRENCDCKACERNNEIKYRLKLDDLEGADRLAEDIENFKLTCNKESKSAWIRMKGSYMTYYMDRREFEKASEYIHLIESIQTEIKESDKSDKYLYCYAHLDMGKALRIYKQHWKKWMNIKNTSYRYEIYSNISGFFYELKKEETKLHMSFDKSFPLYREDEVYQVEDLYQYYYKEARFLAEKFDERSQTTVHRETLEKKVSD